MIGAIELDEPLLSPDRRTLEASAPMGYSTKPVRFGPYTVGSTLRVLPANLQANCCPGPILPDRLLRCAFQCIRFATVRFIIKRHRPLSSVSRPRDFITASQTFAPTSPRSHCEEKTNAERGLRFLHIYPASLPLLCLTSKWITASALLARLNKLLHVEHNQLRFAALARGVRGSKRFTESFCPFGSPLTTAAWRCRTEA